MLWDVPFLGCAGIRNLPQGSWELPSGFCSGKLRAAMMGWGWLGKAEVLWEVRIVIYKALGILGKPS